MTERTLGTYLIALLVVLVTVTPVTSETANESAQIIDLTVNPPNGTQIDKNLSEYYGMPVAEGANGTFWYVEQSWYSSEEIVNRVANTQKHKVSTSDQNTFGSEKNYLISMPVNFLVVVAFVCIAYHISKRMT
ncbi:hypothetical protein [Methanomethylovorans sp.]|uniref:hypothetical protein n=1 Tax=Methanomethylovorans sp. TaxID=2758717 RepID=UPI00351C4572